MYHGYYACRSQPPRTSRLRLNTKTLFTLFFLLCTFSTSAQSNSDVEQFKAWKARLSAGEHEAWKDYIEPLQGRPLFPYLHYTQLSAELSDWNLELLKRNGTYERTRAFLEVWPELHVSDNLKRQWLRRLGKEGDWKALLRQEVSKPPTDIQCLRLYGLHETQSESMRHLVLDQAKKLWLAGRSQPKRCDPLFDLLFEQDLIQAADYQVRIRNALKAGNLSFARWLLKKLPNAERRTVQAWFDLRSKPDTLGELFSKRPTLDNQDLARQAMHWLAGNNAGLAAELWPEFLRFAEPNYETQQKLWRRLALKAARSSHPNALAWLANAKLKADDSYGWGWFMRAALREQNWAQIRAIKNEPLTLDRSSKAALDYWAAYAARELGNEALAEQEWKALSSLHHWYGYLAADTLGQPYQAADPLPESDALNRKLLMSYQGARRARDLYLVGSDWLARGEWAALLKTIPADLAQEAALLANELNWPSMAARTQAVYTRSNPDETLFPLPWEALVTSAAQQNQVAPAHIWSQMRAESLFMKDARSGAGAVGLMQLMPATARSVGKSLRLKNWRRLPLRDPATNIQLGSRYIADMLKKFDHRVPLAAAAYNAGPHRVERWLEERPYTDPILWVEFIPFTETRRYVQRSLYFHSRYDNRLHGEPSRIIDLLNGHSAQLAQAAP